MRAAFLLALLCGCTLTFPLDGYDEGSGGGGNGAGGSAAGGGVGEGGGGSPPECDGGPEPPLSAIASDFDAGLGDDVGLWDCAVLVDGEVHMEAFPGQYCWFYTTGSHRLACDSISFRVLEVGNQAVGVQRFIYLEPIPGGATINVLQEGGGFGGDFVYVDPSFSLTEDAWWRLRADETTVYFETSRDGVMWNPKGSAEPGFPLDQVSVMVGAGNWNNVPDPGLAVFDCLNVPPPCGD